jgi:hypothetical protein
MMTTSFVACGSDDDDNSGNKSEQPEKEVEPGKLVSGSAEFTVNTTALDALKTMSADGKLMVRYTYENGAVQTEELTSDTYQKAVNYSLNDKGEVVASMQVYIDDINEEKVREIIGTQYMEVSLLGTVTLKYENTNVKYGLKNGMSFKQFDRTDEMVNAAVRSLQHDKERHGIIPLATYGLKVSDANGFSSGSSWLGK